MRPLAALVVGSLFLPVLLLIGSVKFGLWPKNWKSEQQVALIAALVGALVPLYAAGSKALYDEQAAHQAHDRHINELIFNGYEEYSRALIYPLLATSGDLAAALKWDVSTANDETKAQILYEVCRYTECVSHLRVRYSRASQAVPQRGLLLSSSLIEDVVWSLVVEPWALGVPGALGEAIANTMIRDEAGKLVPISRFDGHTNPADIRYLRDSVMETLKENEVRELLSDTLFALNFVLDWATMLVLKPWYGSIPGFPRVVLDPLIKASDDLRLRTGLQLPDLKRIK
jgi:hypothetical protein